MKLSNFINSVARGSLARLVRRGWSLAKVFGVDQRIFDQIVTIMEQQRFWAGECDRAWTETQRAFASGDREGFERARAHHRAARERYRKEVTEAMKSIW